MANLPPLRLARCCLSTGDVLTSVFEVKECQMTCLRAGCTGNHSLGHASEELGLSPLRQFSASVQAISICLDVIRGNTVHEPPRSACLWVACDHSIQSLGYPSEYCFP